MDFFRGRRKKITHAQSFWASEAAGERTISWLGQEHMSQNTVSTVPSLQHRVRNTKPIQIKQSAYSAAFFSWAASSLQAAPLPPPAFLSLQLKTSERKGERSCSDKGPILCKRRARTPENTVTVSWARCWQVTPPVVVGFCSLPRLRCRFWEQAVMKNEGAAAPAPPAPASWMCPCQCCQPRICHLRTFSEQLRGAGSSQSFPCLLPMEILTLSRDTSSGAVSFFVWFVGCFCCVFNVVF